MAGGGQRSLGQRGGLSSDPGRSGKGGCLGACAQPWEAVAQGSRFPPGGPALPAALGRCIPSADVNFTLPQFLGISNTFVPSHLAPASPQLCTHTSTPRRSQRPSRAGESSRPPLLALSASVNSALCGAKSAVPSAPPRPLPLFRPARPTCSPPHSALTSTFLRQPQVWLHPPRPPQRRPWPGPSPPGPAVRGSRVRPEGGRGRGGTCPCGPSGPAGGWGGPGVLTSLELRLPRTYLARARGGSGRSRSRSGGSRRRSAGARGGSIPPAPAPAPLWLRLPLWPGDGGESARAGQRAPPIKGAAGLSGPRPLPPGGPTWSLLSPLGRGHTFLILCHPAPAPVLSS